MLVYIHRNIDIIYTYDLSTNDDQTLSTNDDKFLSIVMSSLAKTQSRVRSLFNCQDLMQVQQHAEAEAAGHKSQVIALCQAESYATWLGIKQTIIGISWDIVGIQ